MANNIYPGIDLNYENNNPILSTPNEPFSIQFAQSKESLECDAELYSDFLNNAIFGDAEAITVEPNENMIIGYEKFLENYKRGLTIEKEAVNYLKNKA